MTEPAQKPGRSKQDYSTPPEFLAAVARRFGRIDFDLFASDANAVGKAWFTAEQDAFAQSWELAPWIRVAWANPPFGDLRRVVAKAEECRHLPRWTLVLCPASMGSLWWRDHVLGKCHADGIPRLTFVGETAPYPKDLALLAYGFGVSGTGFYDWRGK
jgi:phage N-6-adenine-methyltransferase